MHTLETGHQFDFNGASVIDKEKSKGGRLVKEAWHSGEGAINRHVDLPTAYHAPRMRDQETPRRRTRRTTQRAVNETAVHQPTEEQRQIQQEEYTGPITRSIARRLAAAEHN